MKPRFFALLLLVMMVSPWLEFSVSAQQHRATRLGHPSTRFADPLHVPQDLRDRLQSEKLKADVASILRQAGWKGDLEDFRKAAGSAEIVEWKIPVGTRLKYMSSREAGKPIVLWDVLWAGKEPIDAYSFVFTSKGRHYRCITPKACSNFWVEDIVVPPPKIELTRSGPAKVLRCDPIEQVLQVRNSGTVPLSEVQLSEVLPDGLRTAENQEALVFQAGSLQPGEVKRFPYQLVASRDGTYAQRATAASAQGARSEAAATLQVRSPVLGLECQAPAMVFAGRPIEVCVTVRNSSQEPGEKIVVVLPLPDGTTLASSSAGAVATEQEIRWDLPMLGAQETRRFCATVTSADPRPLSFRAEASSRCTAPVQSDCSTRVVGIPAILLEVIDLDDPIEVGSNETYEIRVLNQGSAPGTNIKLLCKLEKSQEFVSGDGPTEVRLKEDMIQVEPLAGLAPKATATWKVVVKALQAGDVRFSVEMTSDQIDRPVQETEATQQY